MYVISDQRSNCVVALPALDADALLQSLVPPVAFGRLSLPAGICLDSRHRLHVADMGNNRIVSFAFDTAMWTTFGAGVVTAPRDVAVDSGDRIYAVDSMQVLRVDADDGSGAFVLPGLDDGQRPIAIAVDADDRVFIVDATVQGVWVTEDEGGSWDRLTMPPGDVTSRPVALSAREAGGVLVSDLANHRVVAIDAGGAASTIIAAADGVFSPISAVEDGFGITVLDAGPEWIRRFLPVDAAQVAADFVRGRRADGTRRFGRPAGLAIGAAS
jgi:DNA-binding beta-propeller fold protein YncE